MKIGVYFIVILSFFVACKTKNSNNLKTSDIEVTSTDIAKSYLINKLGDTIPKIVKSNEAWKQILTPLEYNVLREKGTERAFTGDLYDNKNEGLYTCRGCGLPLFDSKHKFDSGTGWPSFFNVLDKNLIVEDTDYDLGYPRTELTCGKCGGHLGHVFSDGPKPTGLRYCINSVSLDFVKTEY